MTGSEAAGSRSIETAEASLSLISVSGGVFATENAPGLDCLDILCRRVSRG